MDAGIIENVSLDVLRDRLGPYSVRLESGPSKQGTTFLLIQPASGEAPPPKKEEEG
jgi:hypothetical protein